MNEHLRAVPGSPGDDAGTHRPTDGAPPGPPPDLMVERIARSLRTRDALQPDPAVVAARLEAQLASRAAAHRTPVRLMTSRGARIAAAGIVTSTLAVGGAGAAAAANPYSPMARTVENVVQAVGIEWSAMPDGYTREQYEAFWGAGFETEDINALAELWGTDTTETKARAGQMLLDGDVVPVAPGSMTTDVTADQIAALWAAGYVWDDALALADLWDVDVSEAKARAAVAFAAGQALPVAPSGEVGGEG
ncbi:hypothetical protein [Cellulomonas sp. S1-8]|uniref:hypothetical protein n=1 Tax=Cellulomonas sp. S1-8 TaxID=2904790 RepID=UPI002242E864|nr:hypothetical protein [Cellulomonas sp. S1-8]UZN01981.1 hypothetical protein OKX07_12895 [Cellulomonas sp. S1-8]